MEKVREEGKEAFCRHGQETMAHEGLQALQLHSPAGGIMVPCSRAGGTGGHAEALTVHPMREPVHGAGKEKTAQRLKERNHTYFAFRRLLLSLPVHRVDRKQAATGKETRAFCPGSPPNFHHHYPKEDFQTEYSYKRLLFSANAINGNSRSRLHFRRIVRHKTEQSLECHVPANPAEGLGNFELHQKV